jgi:hypothetical protein
MTLVVNLYSGPGAGKSTTAALTFGELKSHGVNCEYVQEYAKDLVWGEQFNVLSNQIYVFGKQYQRMHRLMGKVDVIITDAPLLLSLHYGQGMQKSFKNLVLDVYKSMRNVDIMLTRQKAYNPLGRMQTEDEARAIDVSLQTLLYSLGILPLEVNADRDAGIKIAQHVLKILKDDVEAKNIPIVHRTNEYRELEKEFLSAINRDDMVLPELDNEC